MKKVTVFAVAMLFVLGMTTVQANSVVSDDNKAIEQLKEDASNAVESGKWDAFSENLVVALKSDNDGLASTAMGMVIRYGNSLDVENAVFDVMRIYRNHDNESMRRMALVALGQMNNDWAINFLERAERFEGNPVLRQTIRAVVADYRQAHAS